MMAPLVLGQDVHSDFGSGHCALQLTSVRGISRGPVMELLGGTAFYPLTWSPGSPRGGCISSSGYLGQQAFPPSLSPSSSCPTPLGQEASQSDLGCSSCVLRHWTRPIPWGWS